jgi:hypothetical protein
MFDPVLKILGPKRGTCYACLVLVLLTSGALPARAQAPTKPNPEVARLTESAENGDAAAQLQLGMRSYEIGSRKRPPDYAEALKWFRLAADQGNAQAEDRMGMLYYFGRGVPQNYAEAARWYLLAAQGQNEHAERQLIEMYHLGLGVPRDFEESRKWAKVVNARHPDRSTMAVWGVFLCGVLLVVAFAVGLASLQRRVLTGWKQVVVAVLVHVAGTAVLLNSLVTYGFWIVFPHCAHSFLATACTQISDPHTRQIVNQIGDWAMMNLIFRFMAIVGLALDGLAVWYAVYLWQLFFRSHRPSQPLPQRPVPASALARPQA